MTMVVALERTDFRGIRVRKGRPVKTRVQYSRQEIFKV
jgi:hypothetical protein